MAHSKDLPPALLCQDPVCRKAQEAKHRYRRQQTMMAFNARKLSFFLADHNACRQLFMVEFFSDADCWSYLSCHRLDCDLGHWVSPGTITEGIHWFHLALIPACQRQGFCRSHWDCLWASVRAKQGFANLVLLPRSSQTVPLPLVPQRECKCPNTKHHSTSF